MMSNLMRSNSRWLMILICVLMGVSLIWYFGTSSMNRMGTDRVGRIYGRPLTMTELQRLDREVRTATDLGLRNVGSTSRSQDPTDELVNHLVLEHETEVLGIVPSDDEVRETEKKLPVFRGPTGDFDSTKYAEFVDTKLSPRGFTEAQLDALVRQDIEFGKIRELVESGVLVSAPELHSFFSQIFGKTDASLVRFKNADFAAVPEPTEDDIKKYYADQKDQLQQPEKRKVQYVKFGLTDDQKKLMGKERTAALQPLADHAVELLEKLANAKGKSDFSAVAAADKLPVKETAEFEEESIAGLEEANIPQFATSAFKLTAKDPDSDVPLATTDAFYVLHLSGVTPERPLTIDEARPKIVAAIKSERAAAALAAKVEEVRTKIADGLKAGKPFAEAAKDAGQTAEDVPPFSLGEPPRGGAADMREILSASTELGTSEMSKFLATADGGFLLYVKSRTPADEKMFEQRKDTFERQMKMQKGMATYDEWLRVNREAAQVQFDAIGRG